MTRINFDTTQTERNEAADYADKYATVDRHTKDPENVLANKAASYLSEKYVADYLEGEGLTVTVENSDDDRAPIDLTAEGVRIDVKHSLNYPNLMPSKHHVADDRPVDMFVHCMVSSDLEKVTIVGFCSKERFNDEAEYFFPVSTERMVEDDLSDIRDFAEVIKSD